MSSLAKMDDNREWVATMPVAVMARFIRLVGCDGIELNDYTMLIVY